VRLYAKPIKNYANINQFDYGTEWTIRKDEPNTLYFQLVDLDQESLRYLPSDASCSVQLTFPALNSTSSFIKSATQVSALDRSIWSVSLSESEVPFSGNVQIALVEFGVTRRFSLIDGIVVEGLNNGGC
jgi:hypothetical protein